MKYWDLWTKHGKILANWIEFCIGSILDLSNSGCTTLVQWSKSIRVFNSIDSRRKIWKLVKNCFKTLQVPTEAPWTSFGSGYTQYKMATAELKLYSKAHLRKIESTANSNLRCLIANGQPLSNCFAPNKKGTTRRSYTNYHTGKYTSWMRWRMLS